MGAEPERAERSVARCRRAARRVLRSVLRRAAPAAGVLPVLVVVALVAGLLSGPAEPLANQRFGPGTAWFVSAGGVQLADGATARFVGFAPGSSPQPLAVVAQVGSSAVLADREANAVVVAHRTGGSWRSTPVRVGFTVGLDTFVRAGSDERSGVEPTIAWVVTPSTGQARAVRVGQRPAVVGPAVQLPADVAPDQVRATNDGTLWVVADGGAHRFAPRGTSAFTPLSLDGRPRLVLVGDRPVILSGGGVAELTADGDAVAGSHAIRPVADDARLAPQAPDVVSLGVDGVIRVDVLGGGGCAVDVAAGPGEVLGDPAVHEGTVFVPVVATGGPRAGLAEVAVVGLCGSGRPARRVPLGAAGPVEVFSHGGFLWWARVLRDGDPRSQGVITDRFEARLITGDARSGAPAGGATPTAPSRATVPDASVPGRPAPPARPRARTDDCPRNAPAHVCTRGPRPGSPPPGPAGAGPHLPCARNLAHVACPDLGDGGGGGDRDRPGVHGGGHGAGGYGHGARGHGDGGGPWFTWWPLDPTAGQPVTFDVLAGPGSLAWSFAGGSPAVSQERAPEARWSTAGAYEVTLTVTSPHGTQRVTRRLTVAPPPHAGDVVPLPRLVGLPVGAARDALVAAGLAPGATTSRLSAAPRDSVVEAQVTGSVVADGRLLAPGTPVDLVVSTARAPVALATSTLHSCAVLADGTVRCWGAGREGELGNGSTAVATAGVEVQGVTGATTVAVSTYYLSHTCAVASGRVRCWGSNDFGQLGDGSTAGSAVPVEVVGIDDATAVTLGDGYSCALLSGGDVRCWGRNDAGQLGNGSTVGSTVPAATRVHRVTSISAGGSHACAVAAGRVRCWGANDAGQLGIGTVEGFAGDPVDVPGAAGASVVATGADHTCALLAGRRVRCWGANDYGGVGIGVTRHPVPEPVDVPALDGTTALFESGTPRMCALGAGDRPRCWGVGSIFDMVPDPVDELVPAEGSSTPAPVAGLPVATVVSIGPARSCAIAGVHVVCWGYNVDGVLGVDSDEPLVGEPSRVILEPG